MAFRGGIGSGKSLNTEIIMKKFRLQKNVISTIFEFNFQINLNEQKAHLKEIEPRLSECGFNLLVIDDVDEVCNNWKNQRTWEKLTLNGKTKDAQTSHNCDIQRRISEWIFEELCHRGISKVQRKIFQRLHWNPSKAEKHEAEASRD
jgi:reverse gyrase